MPDLFVPVDTTDVTRYFLEVSGRNILFRYISFMIFNLLCAPCFAAMGAIKREMNNAKWTLFAIGYQCRCV